jgi:hypothetical protein
MAMWNDNSDKKEKWSKKLDSVFSGTALAPRCYENHPSIKLGKGTLYGGSASYPAQKKADVYVALQSGSSSGLTSDPWEEQRVIEIHYSVSDMAAPKNLPRFKKMIDYVCEQLEAGKKVHVGCIGGHGRTGTILSAIVAQMTDEKDAIQWVRKHYCKKAVESKEQVEFLMKHYGVSKASGSKDHVVRAYKADPDNRHWDDDDLITRKPKSYESRQPSGEASVRRIIPVGATSSTRTFVPIASARSLWKRKA